MIVIEIDRSGKPEMKVNLKDFEARLRREHSSYTDLEIESILNDTEIKCKNDLWLRSFLE
ncbi:MAG: hypothetical protein KAH57_11920 [Thermoplasmata archaeon]|nr:hypothetical protein [Thermoplasmata archaeon]